MIRRPPRSTHCISSAASDVYKRQVCSAMSGHTVPQADHLWPVKAATSLKHLLPFTIAWELVARDIEAAIIERVSGRGVSWPWRSDDVQTTRALRDTVTAFGCGRPR